MNSQRRIKKTEKNVEHTPNTPPAFLTEIIGLVFRIEQIKWNWGMAIRLLLLLLVITSTSVTGLVVALIR